MTNLADFYANQDTSASTGAKWTDIDTKTPASFDWSLFNYDKPKLSVSQSVANLGRGGSYSDVLKDSYSDRPVNPQTWGMIGGSSTTGVLGLSGTQKPGSGFSFDDENLNRAMQFMNPPAVSVAGRIITPKQGDTDSRLAQASKIYGIPVDQLKSAYEQMQQAESIYRDPVSANWQDVKASPFYNEVIGGVREIAGRDAAKQFDQINAQAPDADLNAEYFALHAPQTARPDKGGKFDNYERGEAMERAGAGTNRYEVGDLPYIDPYKNSWDKLPEEQKKLLTAGFDQGGPFDLVKVSGMKLPNVKGAKSYWDQNFGSDKAADVAQNFLNQNKPGTAFTEIGLTDKKGKPITVDKALRDAWDYKVKTSGIGGIAGLLAAGMSLLAPGAGAAFSLITSVANGSVVGALTSLAGLPGTPFSGAIGKVTELLGDTSLIRGLSDATGLARSTISGLLVDGTLKVAQAAENGGSIPAALLSTVAPAATMEITNELVKAGMSEELARSTAGAIIKYGANEVLGKDTNLQDLIIAGLKGYSKPIGQAAEVLAGRGGLLGIGQDDKPSGGNSAPSPAQPSPQQPAPQQPQSGGGLLNFPTLSVGYKDLSNSRTTNFQNRKWG